MKMKKVRLSLVPQSSKKFAGSIELRQSLGGCVGSKTTAKAASFVEATGKNVYMSKKSKDRIKRRLCLETEA